MSTDKEIKELRKALRLKMLERRKREFDSMPKEVRDAFTAVGASPYQRDVILRRTGGKLSISK